MARERELYSTKAIVRATTARVAAQAVLVGGVFAAALGWEPGILVALGGFSATVLAHLVVGVAAYRRAMRRPWPAVPPLADDDWD